MATNTSSSPNAVPRHPQSPASVQCEELEALPDHLLLLLLFLSLPAKDILDNLPLLLRQVTQIRHGRQGGSPGGHFLDYRSQPGLARHTHSSSQAASQAVVGRSVGMEATLARKARQAQEDFPAIHKVQPRSTRRQEEEAHHHRQPSAAAAAAPDGGDDGGRHGRSMVSENAPSQSGGVTSPAAPLWTSDRSPAARKVGLNVITVCCASRSQTH